MPGKAVEGDSAIDMIKAAKVAGWSGVSLAWDGANQEVKLVSGTDLGEKGLVLVNDGSGEFNADTNNSPATVVIDGLWPGREVALTGSPGAPLITVGEALPSCCGTSPSRGWTTTPPPSSG
jgi:hypothetical protein